MGNCGELWGIVSDHHIGIRTQGVIGVIFKIAGFGLKMLDHHSVDAREKSFFGYPLTIGWDTRCPSTSNKQGSNFQVVRKMIGYPIFFGHPIVIHCHSSANLLRKTAEGQRKGEQYPFQWSRFGRRVEGSERRISPSKGGGSWSYQWCNQMAEFGIKEDF